MTALLARLMAHMRSPGEEGDEGRKRAWEVAGRGGARKDKR